MKKYLSACILVFFTSVLFAQTFQASIEPVPSAAGVTVVLKTSAAKTGKVSSLTITIAIPVSVGPRPVISSVDNSADPYITYILYDAVNQSVGGTMHYIYNVLGTGDVVNAGATVNFAANTDIPMARINFGGDPGLSSQIKMVNLPDGGTDPNPNSFFGFSVDGADDVYEPAMFYGIAGVSSAVNDGNGYSGTSYAQTVAAVALPVKFMGFTATRRDNNALLNWQVANESVLTDHYEIERSVNGTSYKNIGAVPAKNNGNASNSYDITDLNLSSAHSAGIFYYRVKQVDKDAHFLYSEIRSVRLTSKGVVVNVYPNPVRDFANILIDMEQDGEVAVTINDASGKQVQHIQMQLLKGPNTKQINMARYAAGSYMLKLQTPAEITSIPFIKVN